MTLRLAYLKKFRDVDRYVSQVPSFLNNLMTSIFNFFYLFSFSLNVVITLGKVLNTFSFLIFFFYIIPMSEFDHVPIFKSKILN